MQTRPHIIRAALAALARSAVSSLRRPRRTNPSSCASRTGCRRPIRCRSRWKTGAPRSRRPRAARIKYKVYPSQQLGKAFDHYDMARDGIADLTYVNPGYQPGRFPIIGAGELPFLDLQRPRAARRRSMPGIANTPSSEMKDVKFCLAFFHDPGSFHSKAKKITVPGDIKGMKIRPAHATMATFMTQLGATNVQSSAPEVRDILEKGVAEAVTFPWGSVPLFGIDKVTKYHMEVPLYVTTFAFVFNKSTYSQMSAAQKKVIDDHCTNEWARQGGGHRGQTSSTPASPS